MLANLKIENVAVIEKAEVNFTPGFNVLTGETGAGKSILIDSINAILGNRTSRELVRSGAQKACIWATFENIPQSVKKQLEKCGYEANDDLLLYREINAEGKGSCRVNGMPATAAVVRDISAGLLSIHGQHDSQSLTNPALHLGLLDQYAQNRDLFADYYRRYRELVTVKRQLDALNASEADKQRKIEALTAEIDAIDAAALQPGEEKTCRSARPSSPTPKAFWTASPPPTWRWQGMRTVNSPVPPTCWAARSRACRTAPGWTKRWPRCPNASTICTIAPATWPPSWPTAWTPTALTPASWT